MRVIALTPHPINILDAMGNPLLTLDSEGLARVTQLEKELGNLYIGDHIVPLLRSVYGPIEGLPDPQAETMFVVSSLVRSAAPTRLDLISPTRFLRDAAGRILGCQAFTR